MNHRYPNEIEDLVWCTKHELYPTIYLMRAIVITASSVNLLRLHLFILLVLYIFFLNRMIVWRFIIIIIIIILV